MGGEDETPGVCGFTQDGIGGCCEHFCNVGGRLGCCSSSAGGQEGTKFRKKDNQLGLGISVEAVVPNASQ